MNTKKSFITLVCTSCLAAIIAFAAAGTISARAYDSTVWDNANPLEQIDEDSYFGSCWAFTDIGSKRLDDRAVIVTDHAAWGRRGQILKRQFDLTSFYIEFDCSQLYNKTALMLAFGPEGIYASENGKILSLDIVRGDIDNTAYIVTVSTTASNSGHATSIPSFTDGQTWADDANFTGVQCVAADGIIKLSFHKDNDTQTTIKLNDVSTTVLNSELYARCVDSTKGYLSIGLMNNEGPSQKYIIRKFGDADTDVYYGADGAFGKTKSECEAITALETNGYTTEQILALKERLDAVPYSDMYSYDRKWLATSYNAATEKVNNLITSAGQAVTLKIFENKVNAIPSVYTTAEEINAGLSAYNAAASAKEDIKTAELTGEQQTSYDAIVADLDAAYTAVTGSMQSVYETAVAAFEAAANGTVDSSDAYLSATALQSAIPTSYNEYLSEEVTNGFATRIETAETALQNKAQVTYPNWEQGKNAHPVMTSAGIDLITAGDAYGEKADSSGLYYTQALDVLDFDVVLNFSSLGGAPTGAWITFGLMQNSGMWINADNDTIQDNKGVFFLVSKLNSKTLNVQCFICTLTCNTFYDSVLTQTIEIPLNKDIKVSFTAVEKKIAGVTDTYYNMDFGGTSFDEEVIKTRTLKTVFGSALKGYFFVASAGIPTSDPAVVKIGQINGKNLTESDLSKEQAADATPTTTDTTAAFTAGTDAAVSFNFDAKEKGITAVKVDGKAISAGDYTFENSTLTLTNDFLSTLSAGSHTVDATTSGGTCSWTLNVSEASQGGGCGGNALSYASVIVFLLVAAAAVVFNRRREN